MRRLFQLWLILFGISVSAGPGFADGKIPYWAGYQSQMTTNESSATPPWDEGLPATLHIEYSKDGRTYSAWWHYDNENGGIGECSGKVDQSGNLETTDCTPEHKNQTRELGGTILKIEISGGSWHEPVWHDETLQKNKGKLLAIAAAKARSPAAINERTGQGTNRVVPPPSGGLPPVLEGVGFAEDRYGDRHPVKFVLKKKADRYVVAGTLVVEGETYGLDCGELTPVTKNPLSFGKYTADPCTSSTHTVSRMLPELKTSGRVLHLSRFRIGEYGARVIVEESRITLLYGADLAQFRARSKREKGLSSAAFLKIANAQRVAEKKRRVAEEAKKKAEAERHRIKEENVAKKRLQELTAKLAAIEAAKIKLEKEAKRKAEAEKKRKVALAQQKAAAKRKAEAEKKRKVALAAQKKAAAKRKAEAEKKRKAALARKKAEAVQELALYHALAQPVKFYLASAQKFVTQNSETPGLFDIVTEVAKVKAAMQTKKGSPLKDALLSLRTTLSKENGFSEFIAKEKMEKQRRLAEARRVAEENRRQELAAAKRQAEKKRRKRAAEVKELQTNLKAYAKFLKNQVVKNMVSNSKLSQALIPVVKSLEGAKLATDLAALKGLEGQARKVIRKHRLHFPDFQKGLTAARSGDYATALREWAPLADQGHARAQSNLGLMYEKGYGVPQDYRTAVKWWKLAAKQGYAHAQSKLGVMYYNGKGVPQNDKTAVKWWKLAAKQKYKPAFEHLKLLATKEATKAKDATKAEKKRKAAVAARKKAEAKRKAEAEKKRKGALAARKKAEAKRKAEAKEAVNRKANTIFKIPCKYSASISGFILYAQQFQPTDRELKAKPNGSYQLAGLARIDGAAFNTEIPILYLSNKEGNTWSVAEGALNDRMGTGAGIGGETVVKKIGAAPKVICLINAVIPK